MTFKKVYDILQELAGRFQHMELHAKFQHKNDGFVICCSSEDVGHLMQCASSEFVFSGWRFEVCSRSLEFLPDIAVAAERQEQLFQECRQEIESAVQYIQKEERQ